VPPEKVVVVWAGSNLRDALPRQLDPDRPMILFVGRDWEQKGGPLLLDAFRLVRAAVPTARLAVVGCRPRLEDEPGVDIVGPLDASDPDGKERLRRLYAEAACFSILSRFDAFPNVLLEAGLAGVPVVSTAEGSRPEAVLDGETGLLVAERDPEQIAAAMVSLFGDPDRNERMGRAATAWVRERFTWPAVADRVGDALEWARRGG
jgi:glycosyltransferase involved in cell wall biosynthesis